MPARIHAILAAVDLSSDSTEVLQAAGSLSAATGADLHVVHAFEPARGLAGEDVPRALAQVPGARDSLWAAMRRASPAREPIDARVIVWTGRPAPIILEAAKEIGADLIVLGRHRARALGDGVRSTTAEQLLREGAVPCLIVLGPLAVPPRRIVVPHDVEHDSPPALTAALRWVVAMQECTNDAASIEVEVVHVDPAASAGPEAAWWHKARQEKLADTVAWALRLDPLDHRVRVRQRVLEGILPVEGILRTARESSADLLVMSTHADHPLVRMLFGTVSGAVLRQGRVPMLLIPPPVVAEVGIGQLGPAI